MVVYLPRSLEAVMIQMVLDRRPESNIEDTLMTRGTKATYRTRTTGEMVVVVFLTKAS